MRRRTLLGLAGGGLVAIIAAGAVGVQSIPAIPGAPVPDAETALGWITYHEGRYTLTLPRAELGQNIATALKQIACAELGVAWDALALELHDTGGSAIRSTAGSESVMLFAEPLAQACAALRDAVSEGRAEGEVTVATRPKSDLRAFQDRALVGTSPRLAQGREIATGAPLYAADIRRPGMVYGRVLRAPAAPERRSRPLQWNAAAAAAVPGFVGIVEESTPTIGGSSGLGILASRPGALDKIADALAVLWEIGALSDRASASDGVDVDDHLVRDDLPTVVLDGDPPEGPWDLDLRIDIPAAAHGAIEPRSAVAEWREDRLTLWAGTQDAVFVRDYVAHALGVAADRITVRTCRVGGAFGGKMFCTVEAEAAALSRAAGVPVKVQWTRAQEYGWAFHRPPSSHRIKARLRGGEISAWDHAQVSSPVIFSAAVLPGWMQQGIGFFAGDDGIASGMAAPYRLGDARARFASVGLPIHTGPWRGLGAGPNGLVIETMIDALAWEAGRDPVAFRLDHIDDPRLAGVLIKVADVSGWYGPSRSAEGVRIGRGVACGVYNGVSYAAVVAEVEVTEAGAVRVTEMWCAHDCGFIINPDQVRAQCEGNLAFGIGMVLVDDLPFDGDRVSAETFLDAPIPRSTEVPVIHVDLVETDLPPTGAGETGMVAAPGAIAAAVHAATGFRPTRFPIRPQDLAL